MLTDVKLVDWHAPYLFAPFTFVYSALLYAGSVSFDKPIYSFLPFKDWKSPAICLGLVIFFMSFYLALAKIQECCSKETLE
jgi:hypothetical protein